MDTNSKSQESTKINDVTWKNQFETLIKLKPTLGAYLNSVSIYLPFGILVSDIHNLTTMTPFQEFPDSVIWSHRVANHLNNRKIQPRSKHFSKIYLMTLGIKRHKDKVRLYLEMTFPIALRNINTIHDMHMMSSGFLYSWNKKRATIQRNLGTSNPEVVLKQIKILLKECNRFYFMYNS